jgi:hypothetical protein
MTILAENIVVSKFKDVTVRYIGPVVKNKINYM